MARMRSLKPEFWLDRKLARTLSRDERMLYLGLWNQADEYGRANGDARVIKGQVFPFDDDLTDAVIETMLKALEAAGVVVQYESGGDPFLYLPKLAKHQRLEPHKVPTRFPEPPDTAPDQDVCALPGSDPDGTQTGSERRPGPVRAKHVAGSREHVAGQRGADAAPGVSFETFYAAYPRKEARRAAEKAWAAALKRAPAQTIIDGLQRFHFAPERRFIPQPASWLNADRWADGQSPDGSTAPPPALTRKEIDDVLGEDSWQLPAPPMDPEEDPAGFRRWAREATDAHRAERVGLALAQMARS